jgi:TatD DNase family protein
MFVDSHSHIYSEEFNGDREEAIQRALDLGVSKIVLPNIDSSSIKPMLDLVSGYPEVCFPLMGLHPTSVKENYTEELDVVKQWLDQQQFYGIGEIGIDLYWDKTFLEEQIDAFRIQVQWAKERDLPVVIHVRESFDEVFGVLEKEAGDNLKGVFHSFTGSAEQAQRVIDLGFKIGINGIVTFRNSGLGAVVERVALKNLLLETDSPYLSPVPKRGKRNESSNIIYIAEKIAELHSVSLDEIERVTTENTVELFGV